MTKGKVVEFWNPQWGCNAEIPAGFYRRMAAHYFAPWHTGGGCMAWRRDCADGGYLMITNDDEENPSMIVGPPRRATWLLGRYNAEGDAWVMAGVAGKVMTVTLARALELAEVMPAPSGGDQEETFWMEGE